MHQLGVASPSPTRNHRVYALSVMIAVVKQVAVDLFEEIAEFARPALR